MFLKRERPETDDFVIKNIWLLRKNTFKNLTSNFVQVLADTLKKCLNISLYTLAFQNIPSIFYLFFQQKPTFS